MLTLWSIARSPLVLGANLTELDPWTAGLITNREVIRVDQTATASRQVLHDRDMVAWTADLPTGETALAIFNIRDEALQLAQPLTAFGVPAGQWHARDVWHGTALADDASVRQAGAGAWVCAAVAAALGWVSCAGALGLRERV